MLGSDLRRAVSDLTVIARKDLAALWRQAAEPGGARAVLTQVLPDLVDTYGAAAGTVAADWYDQTRDTQKIKGRFTAIPAAIDDTGTQALIGWALNEATDYDSFQTLIEGGVQRRIANFARDTITGSSVADPRARGWQRIGAGECAFCAMLIGRGAVYTEATADFGSHDHCNCQPVPAFDGEPVPVQPYTPTGRDITDADHARVRDWIASQ